MGLFSRLDKKGGFTVRLYSFRSNFQLGVLGGCFLRFLWGLLGFCGVFALIKSWKYWAFEVVLWGFVGSGCFGGSGCLG